MSELKSNVNALKAFHSDEDGMETIQVVEEAGGRVMAAGALIDRSGGAIEFDVEAQSLLQMPISSYEPEDCPLCRQGGFAVKPGSRFARTAP